MPRLNIDTATIGFEHTGFMQREFFKTRVVGNAAILAEFLQAFATIKSSDLVSRCFNGAVRFGCMGDASVENASRRVFEKLLRHVLENGRIVTIRRRLMGWASRNWPGLVVLRSRRAAAQTEHYREKAQTHPADV